MSQEPASRSRRAAKAVVKIDNFVRKHTSEIDVETLSQKGVRRINYLTFTKINELVGVAVAKAFQKYELRWSQAEAQRIEADARQELVRQIDWYKENAALHSGQGFTEAARREVAAKFRELVTRIVREQSDLAREAGGSAPDLERFEGDLLEIVGAVIDDERRRAGTLPSSESAREADDERVELLERRIAKMREQLGRLEGALKAMEANSEEAGIPSVYREVQGLSVDDSQYETKKSLLQIVFEENVKLQCKDSDRAQAVP